MVSLLDILRELTTLVYTYLVLRAKEKCKNPDRNVGNLSKSEVLHEDTVVLHYEAVRRQLRYPLGGSQDLQEGAASSPQGDSAVKSSTRWHLSSPRGSKQERSAMTIN